MVKYKLFENNRVYAIFENVTEIKDWNEFKKVEQLYYNLHSAIDYDEKGGFDLVNYAEVIDFLYELDVLLCDFTEDDDREMNEWDVIEPTEEDLKWL